MKYIYLFLFSSFFSAQDLTLVYEMNFKSNSTKDKITTENYFLDVKNSKSVFRSEKNRKSDSLKAKTGFGLGFNPNFNNQFGVKKEYVENKVYKIINSPLFNDVYLIKPDILEWIITDEKLKIGEYDCQKASVNYGGRKWTSWFTTSIPISDGPYVFNGLPGVVIKVFDERREFSFDLIKVQKNNWDDLYEIESNKEINWETFANLQNTYYQQPFAEVRSRSIPMARSDENGKTVSINSEDMREMEENIRKNIRENYNPIEIDRKIKYK